MPGSGERVRYAAQIPYFAMRLYFIFLFLIGIMLKLGCGINNGVRKGGKVNGTNAAKVDSVGSYALTPDSLHRSVESDYPVDASRDELPDSLTEKMITDDEMMEADNTDKKPPHPVGGIRSLTKKIRYTEEARNKLIEGRVIVKFVVLSNGAVCCATVKEGLSHGLNKVALRAVTTTKFEPGTMDGKTVPVEMELPLRFNLD